MRSNRISKIDTGALTAVLLVVVMLFIFSFFLLFPRRTSVDLAKCFSPVAMRGELRDDAISVGIMRDGTVFLDGTMIGRGKLPAAIQSHLKEGAERKVYIRADARSRYGYVKDVIDDVRAVGIENVAFIVEQRKPVQ